MDLPPTRALSSASELDPASPSTQSTDVIADPDQSGSFDFLKITPTNDQGKLAFSELLEKQANGDLDPHHGQYLVAKGTGPLNARVALGPTTSDESTDQQSSDDESRSEIRIGWYRLNFNCTQIAPGNKWAIGKGSSRKLGVPSRNVDILLAAPRSKYSRDIRATHAFLNIHPDSGVWMIYAAVETDYTPLQDEESRPASPKATVFLDSEQIKSEEFRCLTKPRTTLAIQGMEFRIEFVPQTLADAEIYCHHRNIFLRKNDSQPPEVTLTGIPLDSDVSAGGLAIFGRGLGSGTSGTVYDGYDPMSGDLRAIKKIIVKRSTDVAALRLETDMVDLFGSTPGLIRQYGWCTSNGDVDLYPAKYPYEVYIVLEMGIAFNRYEGLYGVIQSERKLRLLRDLLQGLAAIHQRGYIHRDITPQNIIIHRANERKAEVMRAGLCDFGKVYQRASDIDTRLAAWYFLPPEIVEFQDNIYDQSIDVWILSLAVVCTWYPQTTHDAPRHDNNQLTTGGIEQIQKQLSKLDSDVTRVLSGMLAVSPNSRPRAENALEHPAFRNLDISPQKSTRLDNASEGEH